MMDLFQVRKGDKWVVVKGGKEYVCLFCSFSFFMDLFIFTFQMLDFRDDSPRLNNEMPPLQNTRRF